jgi:hypothetical protein
METAFRANSVTCLASPRLGTEWPLVTRLLGLPLLRKDFQSCHRENQVQPVRADADIFGTGKIIDQVWRGINAAKVLVAELTTRNPNVFYATAGWQA